MLIQSTFGLELGCQTQFSSRDGFKHFHRLRSNDTKLLLPNLDTFTFVVLYDQAHNYIKLRIIGALFYRHLYLKTLELGKNKGFG